MFKQLSERTAASAISFQNVDLPLPFFNGPDDWKWFSHDTAFSSVALKN